MYPPLEPQVLLWAFHLSWPGFVICYVENPFTLSSALRFLFTLCYLRGFFAFEQDVEQIEGLTQNQLSVFIIMFVIMLNIRSPNSLIKVPTALVFWSCLLLFFGSPNFLEFDLKTGLWLSILAFLFRPVLLFGMHCLAHGLLRKRISRQPFRSKLFYLCPTLEESQYFSAKIPGEKSRFKALMYIVLFLLWSLALVFLYGITLFLELEVY